MKTGVAKASSINVTMRVESDSSASRTINNVNARVVLYADKITNSMQGAIEETNRRRDILLVCNKEHGITPGTIRKTIKRGIEEKLAARTVAQEAAARRRRITSLRNS